MTPHYNVAILGATGAVGQRFLQLLEHHPWFTVKALMGSEHSVGKLYRDATQWMLESELPTCYADMKLVSSHTTALPPDIDIIFSAIPAEAAREIEGAFAKAGYSVFSNTRTYRMEKDIPLMVPEVNPLHLALIKQQSRRGWKGCIITNPNCIVIPLVMALKPLHDAFGVTHVIVSTMQAISGAGYPGVASLDIVDNIIPYIADEEEKIITETQKILGTPKAPARIKISPSCHRVAVVDGHTIDARIGLQRPATATEIIEVLRNYTNPLASLNLPSSPASCLTVLEAPNRPQPKLDRMRGNGMTVCVGRIRPDEVLQNGIKMIILGHNTIRGAAGGAILNAEYYLAQKKYRV